MVASLGLPILQLEMGKFVPRAPRSLALAVLHPRKLSVYSVQRSEGANIQFSLDQLYTRPLGNSKGEHFTAYNMCKGPFGGHGDGGDGICVQSMDGKLMVFEEGVHILSRRFTNCLLPGPLAYIPKTDAFITATSSGEVECFKFKALAEAGDSQAVATNKHLDSDSASALLGERPDNRRKADETANKKGPKTLSPYWSLRVGETVVEIRVGRISEGRGDTSLDLVVLGERTLFILNEANGTIRSQLRLNASPSTLCLYARMNSLITGPTHPSVALADIPHEGHNVILANFEQQLLVYAGGSQEETLEGEVPQKDSRVGLGALVWSAHLEQLSGCVVCLAVASFGGTAGLVVVLDERGVLRVCYLGTDPPTSAVVTPSTGDLDYASVDKEHKRLTQLIKEHGLEKASESKDGSSIELSVEVPAVCEDTSKWSHEMLNEASEIEEGVESGLARDMRGHLLSVCANITLCTTGENDLSHVDVMVQLPNFAVAKESSFSIPLLPGSNGHHMSDSGPVVIPVRIFATRDVLPESLNCVVTATYFSENGNEPRTVTSNFELPLSLACSLVPPTPQHKSLSSFKLTLTTNQNPCLLKSLFSDLLHSFVACRDVKEDVNPVTGSAGNTVMVFRYTGLTDSTHDVTILVSKSGGRYRVQSASLPALWMTTYALWFRLSKESTKMVVSYSDDPPLKDFITVVDTHLASRHRLVDAFSKLNDSSHQVPLPLFLFIHLLYQPPSLSLCLPLPPFVYTRTPSYHPISLPAYVQLRVVQKRLLAKFKDRNPSPLGQLGPLMELAHGVVISSAETVEAMQKELKGSANHLSAVTSLLNLLIKLRFGLSQEEASVLEACLSPIVDIDSASASDPLAVGWEEITDAALTHLLRTALSSKSNSGQSASAAVDGTPLTISKDTSKLQRHLTILCDRLQKGGSLVVRRKSNLSAEAKSESKS